MEVFILPKQAAKLQFFVCFADFLTDKPAHATEQPRFSSVEKNAVSQELNPLDDPRVAIVVVIKLHRNVVREVVGLEVPNGIEVGLQLCHLLKGC